MNRKYIYLTRAQHEEQFKQHGIRGALLEELLKESAQERHLSRVDAAIMAARDYVSGKFPNAAGDILEGYACAVLFADVAGIGGRRGVEGASTWRHPGLESLGKGRKHAMDGPAWSAAIKEAAWKLLGNRDESGFWADGNGSLMLQFRNQSLLIDGVVEPPWAHTIARDCLRIHLNWSSWLHYEIPMHFYPETRDERIRNWVMCCERLLELAQISKEPCIS